MIATVANKELPLLYRSHMLNLLSLMFLECEPNADVRFLNPLLLSKNKAGGDFRRPSICTQTTAGYFIFAKFPDLAPDLKYPELKRVVMQLCYDEARFSDDDPDLTTFSCSLLHVVGTLLRYGKFGKEEVTTPVVATPMPVESNELHMTVKKEGMKDDSNELDQLIPLLVKMLETDGNNAHLKTVLIACELQVTLRGLEMSSWSRKRSYLCWKQSHVSLTSV